MLTLNQLIEKQETIKASNDLLNNGTFYFGDPWEFGASNKIVYPFWGSVLNNATINGNTLTTSFQWFFCDLVHKDESSEQDVLSDMQIAALQCYSAYKYELENNLPAGTVATINESATLEDFTERFDDEVTGWVLNVNIDQFFDRSVCPT